MFSISPLTRKMRPCLLNFSVSRSPIMRSCENWALVFRSLTNSTAVSRPNPLTSPTMGCSSMSPWSCSLR